MSKIARTAKVALTLSALSIALLSACTPSTDAPGGSGDEQAAAGTAEGDAPVIEGLEGDKAQASYMIGMEIGKSLEPMKDEIDTEVLFKAVRDSLDGKPPLLSEEQVQQVASRFGEHMAKKMEAEREAEAKKNAEAGRQFLALNGKKEGVKTTGSGLQYEVISEGSGPKPKAEDVVRVHYKGTLLDGSTFDDSTARGEPAVFPLGQVVPGWREGLTLMPVGSKYRFWIPGELGYGEMGTPGGPIGPNATLVFEVELLGIEEPTAN
ncbi:FKBP-type peptidyl-prolyl cis-trans isomerase [Marilutibacter chinensis]|uniref:Peptidyl-prolyl cis-trans isomerase n=1 Tax=Marilutibacter chinensis TaxID=2912247 RepID=A0ABS9HQ76_9GAMM|nr:FKBP-type peptidyl-prolyl cis-trans isomerase [Lysobacter chinensis]MCF7220252.1 FKBP-type peptidyl-prolyl cis-trans isomerase [Lysobacter chinensis]